MSQEVAAAAAVSTYTESKTLAEKVTSYLSATSTSIADLAREINYSRTAVSRYLSNKYDMDRTDSLQRSTLRSRCKRLTKRFMPGVSSTGHTTVCCRIG